MTMISGTSWEQRTGSSTKTTIKFFPNDQFTFTQRESFVGNRTSEIVYEGLWKLQRSNANNELEGDGTIQLTVQYISAGEPDLLTCKYRHDLEQHMHLARRAQGQIIKALNVQEMNLERLEMNIGRPGYDEYLKVVVEQQQLEYNQTANIVQEEKEEPEQITLCSCINRNTKHKKQKIWWCTQCKTTECQLCAKETCYLGLEIDHQDLMVDQDTRAEDLKQQMLKNASARDVAKAPEYYALKFKDFEAQWRIMKSSTVVKQYR
jgi:hypothetical protein